MYTKKLLLLICFCLLGGLRLTSTTTTTTFVAAMSIANQDLGRYFHSANSTHTVATMTEERIMLETYALAFLNYTYVNNGKTEFISFRDEQARYGEGRVFSVTGKLVHITKSNDSQDDTACSPDILGTNQLPFPNGTWIALVRRGSCTFEEKVKNVYAMNAAGVIVYNDKPVMNLDKMQIIGRQRDITAVITYQNIGEEMARIADNGHIIVASIIEGKHGKRPITNLNRTSVLFVSISFIVLMVLSLVWLIFYYIQRFRYLHNKDQQSRHLCSVTKKAIMKIPTKTGKNSDEKDLESDCCAICIESYKASDCIRVLPCKHEFHKTCIDPWLIEHRTCPMCKLDVLKFYGFVVGGEQHQITPNQSPQHTVAPNVVHVEHNDAPVVVVAIASQNPPQAVASSTASQFNASNSPINNNNNNISSSISDSSSNNSNDNFIQDDRDSDCNCSTSQQNSRSSECRRARQIASTASRQVTDV